MIFFSCYFIVRDLEVEVQLDAQIEAIPIKHKKM